jgi:hypothetical protein
MHIWRRMLENRRQTGFTRMATLPLARLLGYLQAEAAAAATEVDRVHGPIDSRG